MDDADLDVARAHLLEATGRISEAADVHMAEGEVTLYAIYCPYLVCIRSTYASTRDPAE
jgi:hypothetical protein